MVNPKVIERVGCTQQKQLVFFAENKWFLCLVNDKFREIEDYDTCVSLSEYIVESNGKGKFKTLAAILEKRVDVIEVKHAKLKAANGLYVRLLGGYKNKNGFWIVKNNCGQEMIVHSTKDGTKIIAIKNSNAIMEIDVSASPSEIRCLVNEFMWAKCKKIIGVLRQQLEPQNNYMHVKVHTIENANKGRKSKLWL